MIILKQDKNGVKKEKMMDFIGILCSQGKRLPKRPTSYEFKTSQDYNGKTLVVISVRISNKEMTMIFIRKPEEIKILRESYVDNIYAGGFSMNYYAFSKEQTEEFWQGYF